MKLFLIIKSRNVNENKIEVNYLNRILSNEGGIVAMCNFQTFLTLVIIIVNKYKR